MGTIRISEERCDGCGECVSSCAEGALEIVNGKAQLVREEHCDGLGACLSECPRGAITLVDREKGTGDTASPDIPLRLEPRTGGPRPRDPLCHGPEVVHGVTPTLPRAAKACEIPEIRERNGGELGQWPIQLRLVAPKAPCFRGADLLLAADCAAFARADFHHRFLRGRALSIACPKLDDPDGYVEKLASMMGEGGVRSVTVVTMEVPCCRGLERLAMIARKTAGADVSVRRVVFGIDGGILADQPIE